MGVRAMNKIENVMGKCMHESTHSDLEYRFQVAVDNKDLKEIRFTYYLLTALLDELSLAS